MKFITSLNIWILGAIILIVAIWFCSSNIEGLTGCAAEWAQCGGIGYTGSTCCETGLTCVKENPYYSQCVAGPAPAPAPAPAPTPAPTPAPAPPGPAPPGPAPPGPAPPPPGPAPVPPPPGPAPAGAKAGSGNFSKTSGASIPSVSLTGGAVCNMGLSFNPSAAWFGNLKIPNGKLDSINTGTPTIGVSPGAGGGVVDNGATLSFDVGSKKELAVLLAGYSQQACKISTDTSQLGFVTQGGARVYLCKAIKGGINTEATPTFYLFQTDSSGKLSFSTDICVSGVPSGFNLAAYLTNMPALDANGQITAGDCGDFYCDANATASESCSNRGTTDGTFNWCNEIDLFEGNIASAHMTLHNCKSTTSAGRPSECDGDGKVIGVVGKGINQPLQPAPGYGPSSDAIIDTRKPFNLTVNLTTSGSSTSMDVEVKQGGKSLKSASPITEPNLIAGLKKGMVLMFSFWGSPNGNDWLDGCKPGGGSISPSPPGPGPPGPAPPPPGPAPPPPGPAPPGPGPPPPTGDWKDGLTVTHYYDCGGQSCDAPLLQPYVDSEFVAGPGYTVLDPNDFGGPLYGEKMWIYGAASDPLSKMLGDNIPGLGSISPYDPHCDPCPAPNIACGKSILLKNPTAKNSDWTALVMRKSRCPPGSSGCKVPHMDLMIPGFDNLTYSLSNRCGNPGTGLSKSQSAICGALDNPSDCTKCDSLPKNFSKGCKLFVDWGWNIGNPTCQYKIVTTPPKFLEYTKSIQLGGVDATTGIEGFESLKSSSNLSYSNLRN